VASLKMKLASGGAAGRESSEEIEGVPVVARIVDGLSIPDLRNLTDTLRSRMKDGGVVMVGSSVGGKTAVVVAVTREFQGRVPASRLASKIGQALGGSGGGKADLAQAGGRSEDRLPEGIRAGKEAVRELLAGSPETALKA